MEHGGLSNRNTTRYSKSRICPVTKFHSLILGLSENGDNKSLTEGLDYQARLNEAVWHMDGLWTLDQSWSSD